jgi:hypothetical protein
MVISCCRRPATPARARAGAARCVRWSPTDAPPAGTLMRRRQGSLSGWATASSRPTCTPSAPGRARGRAAGGRGASRPGDHDPAAGRREPGEPPAERERDQQEQGATASPRTTSATPGGPTGSAPTTSARPTAGRCRSRHHGPSPGCRWAATTTRSTTATVRTADRGCSPASPAPLLVMRELLRELQERHPTRRRHLGRVWPDGHLSSQISSEAITTTAR